jgi:hypothetical protein
VIYSIKVNDLIGADLQGNALITVADDYPAIVWDGACGQTSSGRTLFFRVRADAEKFIAEKARERAVERAEEKRQAIADDESIERLKNRRF